MCVWRSLSLPKKEWRDLEHRSAIYDLRYATYIMAWIYWIYWSLAVSSGSEWERTLWIEPPSTQGNSTVMATWLNTRLSAARVLMFEDDRRGGHFLEPREPQRVAPSFGIPWNKFRAKRWDSHFWVSRLGWRGVRIGPRWHDSKHKFSGGCSEATTGRPYTLHPLRGLLFWIIQKSVSYCNTVERRASTLRTFSTWKRATHSRSMENSLSRVSSVRASWCILVVSNRHHKEREEFCKRGV